MDGILLVDKPTGCTSHDVVHRARKLLNTKNIGHAGTLDPLASGLMVLLVGQGTKLSHHLLTGDKGYEVGIRFGIETDSLDITGRVLRQRETSVGEDAVRTAVSGLQGEIELPVPSFSAVKYKGKRLYKYARKDEEVPQIVRRWRFYKIEVLSFSEDRCSVRIFCSKGGYIRSWVQRLGEVLGCGACVESLRRVWSDPFELDGAVQLDRLDSAEKDMKLISLSQALPHWAKIEVEGFDEKLLLNGQVTASVKEKIFQLRAASGQDSVEFKAVSMREDRLLALLTVSQWPNVEISRVFPRI